MWLYNNTRVLAYIGGNYGSIRTLLNAMRTKCNCNDICRLCTLKDFCADRPFTGITSGDFYRNMCFTLVKVIKINGEICLVSLEDF